jgi:pimeloyl-ACP methyl ester carboxylesterase
MQWKRLPRGLVMAVGGRELIKIARRTGKTVGPWVRSRMRARKKVLGLLPWPRARRRSRAGILFAGIGGGVLGTALGGLALLSRVGGEVAPLTRTLDAEPRIFNWRGHRIVFYQKGQGDPVLLLHSINGAASAFEMREPFERLSQGNQVFAIDLLGFGASDRPAIRYNADLYIDLLRDFLRGVVGAPAHVVASSLSAAFAVMVAARDPQAVKSLVLVDPTGMETLAQEQGVVGRIVEGLFRAPLVGQAAFNALVSRPSIRYYLARAHNTPEKVDESMVEQNYRTAHQEGARFPAAAFIGRALNVDLRRVLPSLNTRTLILWTESDFQDMSRERQAFAQANSRLQMRSLPGAGGLIYDVQPERFVAIAREFIGERPGGVKAAPGQPQQGAGATAGQPSSPGQGRPAGA